MVFYHLPSLQYDISELSRFVRHSVVMLTAELPSHLLKKKIHVLGQFLSGCSMFNTMVFSSCFVRFRKGLNSVDLRKESTDFLIVRLVLVRLCKSVATGRFANTLLYI